MPRGSADCAGVEVDAYAVMGNPVAHSKSPYIHAQFARQTGQTLAYTAIHVEVDRFEQMVADFSAGSGKGLNVTIPFKERAFGLARQCTERAQRAGAANTLWFEADGVHADNTDGVGLVRDLQVNLGLSLRGARVLLVGAGGGARGVVGPLLETPLQWMVVANRTESRAAALVADFKPDRRLQAAHLEAVHDRPFDLVINATSASLEGALVRIETSCLAPGATCYDMMYALQPTPFVAWARAAGAFAVDGVGMLVEQAAESFARWRGVRPDTAPVIAALRGR